MTQGQSHTTETPLIDFEGDDVLTIRDAFQAIDGTVEELLGREEVRSLVLEPLERLQRLSRKGLRLVEEAAFRAQEQRRHTERKIAINRDVQAAIERVMPVQVGAS